MDFKLEVTTIPVSDVDRALAFYSEKVGFTVDIDMTTETGKLLAAGASAAQAGHP